ncbi:hypothetical protein MERGE_000892 [Pneumocystis wakefieldiae]|uniref:Mannosyltransferase n=1 Tax=Pneumocystis wakefieldiae TaxID=38082 RepID=A0A899G2Y8_9ASCO|nr:hypothetical protein MERGE_000892 [Pneumocystis wakefieldiae]
MKRWSLFLTMFFINLIPRFLAACYSIIHDCDEVYNYWEPLHYILHDYGFQTWEYSGEYCIRSWFYILLHSIILVVPKSLGFRRITEFFFIRFVFAILCALSETGLCLSIVRILGKEMGFFYFLFTITSVGMFNASTAFLPSTFTMYTSMLGLSAFLKSSISERIIEIIFWFFLGGIIGWPFSLILTIPIIFYQFLISIYSIPLKQVFLKYLKAVFLSVIILVLACLVDSLAYRKFQIVPYISCIVRYIHIFVPAFVLVISFLRVLLIIDAYSAHMSVYTKIPSVSDNFGNILCIGKEWHRFPSSFFVPDNISVKFIKSRFTGLLPGEFISNKNEWRSGLWSIPSNMNDLNMEEWGKYTDISQCDYLIDTDFSARYSFENSTEDIIEPRYHSFIIDRVSSTYYCLDHLMV